MSMKPTAALSLCLFALSLGSCRAPASPLPSPLPSAVLPKAVATAAPLCQRSERVAAEPTYVEELRPNSEPPEPGELCRLSEERLLAASATLLAYPALRPALPLRRWDHKQPPARLELVERRFGLLPSERQQLFRDGFVVPERLADSDYLLALHEVFQSQLPLYVSVDAILHAVYASNDKLLAQLEATLLSPRLDRLLEALHCGLPALAKTLPPEVGRDLDLYLTVARSLLADKSLPSLYAQEAEVAPLLAKLQAAGELSANPLFGRSRMVDFSAYRPRGHYAAEAKAQNPGQADLSAYFRAATWLSRLEFNLVSRSCRSSAPGPDAAPTPREAAAALGLANLVEESGMSGELSTLERAWEMLAGRREDVPLGDLLLLAKRGGIAALDDPALTEKLTRAIGDRYRRSARTHYAWEGCSDLPAISTLLGPRVVADAAATRPLVHGETAGRHQLEVVDLAYALGSERALAYLAPDLARFPSLRANLGRAREQVQQTYRHDLYSEWLAAIKRLAAPLPDGALLPSFMQTAPFADLRLNSTVAAFGQLRHNNVLLAAQTYSEGGCAIPDAFVEPVPAVYDGLAEYAARGAELLRDLDRSDESGGQRYFARLQRLLGILSTIAKDELANRPLSPEQLRFLGMVVEVTGSGRGTGGSPSFTGWYFDLFRDRRDAFAGASLIADFFTSSQLETVAYAGVSGVSLGLFVVDTGGPPRLVVGPVARAFGHHAPLARRLSDSDVAKLSEADRHAPWAAAYTVAPPVEPPLAIEARVQGQPDEKLSQAVTLEVRSLRPLGQVTIELLDHHRQPLGRQALPVGAGETRFQFPARPLPKGSEYFGYEGLHVQVGAWHGWELDARPEAQAGAPRRAISSSFRRAWGGMTTSPPPPEQ